MQYDAILLLGLKLQPDGSPEEELIKRVEKAVECYKKGMSALVIPCGGQLPGIPVSEAAVMRELLMERGVPDAAIILEDKSQITVENIKNAIAVLGGDPKNKHILVVSSNNHIPRALLICRKLGLHASGRGAHLPPTAHWWREVRMEVLYSLDLLMGWQEGKKNRPQWAEWVRKKLTK